MQRTMRSWLGLLCFCCLALADSPTHASEDLIFVRDAACDLEIDEGNDQLWLGVEKYLGPEGGISDSFSTSLIPKGGFWTEEDPPRKTRFYWKTGSNEARLEIDEGDDAAQLSGTYRKITRSEAIDRAKRQFAEVDRELNAVYAKAKSEVGSEGAKKLLAVERDWIGYRNDMAAAQARSEQPKETREYWRVATSLTADQIQFLKIFSGVHVEPGLPGEYIDGCGGNLKLETTKRGVAFAISVVRGPTSHVGEIEGVALPDKGAFQFREKLDKVEEGEEPAEVRITPLNPHMVRIESKNTGAYRGMRAYFDGTYYKKAPLRD